MPASPSNANARCPAQARARAANSAARPIKRGGRIRLAGTTARCTGSVAEARSMVVSSSMVSADGRAPNSSFNSASKRSKTAIAALPSPRR